MLNSEINKGPAIAHKKTFIRNKNIKINYLLINLPNWVSGCRSPYPTKIIKEPVVIDMIMQYKQFLN